MGRFIHLLYSEDPDQQYLVGRCSKTSSKRSHAESFIQIKFLIFLTDPEHSTETLWGRWKPEDSLHAASSGLCCLPAGLQIQRKRLSGASPPLFPLFFSCVCPRLHIEFPHVSSSSGRMTSGRRSARRSSPSLTRPSVHLSRPSSPSCLCDYSCRGRSLRAKLALRTTRLWLMSSCHR